MRYRALVLLFLSYPMSLGILELADCKASGSQRITGYQEGSRVLVIVMDQVLLVGCVS